MTTLKVVFIGLLTLSAGVPSAATPLPTTSNDCVSRVSEGLEMFAPHQLTQGSCDWRSSDPQLLVGQEAVYDSDAPDYLAEKRPSHRRRLPEREELWVQSHIGLENQQSARGLLSSIQHVSQEEFEGALARTVERLNERLENIDGDYILVIETTKSKKSSAWVTDLARPQLTKTPAAVVTDKELKEYMRDNPSVSTAVLFDDAMYTGLQIQDRLRDITLSAKEVIVAVPFAAEGNYAEGTNYPECSLSRKPTETQGSREFIVDTHFPNLAESVDKEGLDHFERSVYPSLEHYRGRCHGTDPRYKHPIYFDHKLADDVSVPVELLWRGEVAPLMTFRDAAEDICQSLSRGDWYRTWKVASRVLSGYSTVEPCVPFVGQANPPYKS